MPTPPASQTTDRARLTRQREWKAAQARKAASASGVFGVAPVNGASMRERTLYVLAVLLPFVLGLVL